MIEKRFSECRDCWIVYCNDKVNTFETEEQADEFITEKEITL